MIELAFFGLGLFIGYMAGYDAGRRKATKWIKIVLEDVSGIRATTDNTVGVDDGS